MARRKQRDIYDFFNTAANVTRAGAQASQAETARMEHYGRQAVRDARAAELDARRAERELRIQQQLQAQKRKEEWAVWYSAWQQLLDPLHVRCAKCANLALYAGGRCSRCGSVVTLAPSQAPALVEGLESLVQHMEEEPSFAGYVEVPSLLRVYRADRTRWFDANRPRFLAPVHAAATAQAPTLRQLDAVTVALAELSQAVQQVFTPKEAPGCMVYAGVAGTWVVLCLIVAFLTGFDAVGQAAFVGWPAPLLLLYFGTRPTPVPDPARIDPAAATRFASVAHVIPSGPAYAETAATVAELGAGIARRSHITAVQADKGEVEVRALTIRAHLANMEVEALQSCYATWRSHIAQSIGQPAAGQGSLPAPAEEAEWPGAGRDFLRALRECLGQNPIAGFKSMSGLEEAEAADINKVGVWGQSSATLRVSVWFTGLALPEVSLMIGLYSTRKAQDQEFEAAAGGLAGRSWQEAFPQWKVGRATWTKLGWEAVRRVSISDLDDDDLMSEALAVVERFAVAAK